MNRFTSLRLIGGAALCLGAIALGSALHLPAVAADEYQHYISPMVSATCASTSPCLSKTNTKSGAGLKGVSASGNGAIGQTQFKSTSSSNGKAGVLGQDVSTTGAFDSGVLGTSANGVGVQGTSVGGYGVEAISANTSGLFAESTTFGDGAQIIGANNDGTNSTTLNDSSSSHRGRSGVWGHDDTTDGGRLNYGVAGSSVNGTGIFGASTNWVGIHAAGGTVTGTFPSYTFYPALSVSANTFDNVPMDIMDGCVNANPCNDGNYVIRLLGNGNVWITGELFTAGSCSGGCTTRPGAQGRRVVSYAPREAQPTMEDSGEAQLVSGRAYVRLDAQFASVVDRSSRYFVFITPEGDCNQLYVTGKTPVGFTVREAHGGTSTLVFQYRIVARPYGDKSARLPSIELSSAPSRSDTHTGRY